MSSKKLPMASVYMTVKNGESVISDAINSILDQTYKNFELVIVDDGSSDGTVSKIARYKSEGYRIKLIESGGVGRAKALNLAVKNTEGEYLFNIDADDYARPERLEQQIAFMRRTKQKFVASKYEIVTEKEKPTWNGSAKIGGCYVANKHIAYHNPINHSSVAFSRELVDCFDELYDESRSMQIDYELWIRLAAQGVCLNVIDPKLVAKRVHSGQSYENKKRIGYLYSTFLLNCSAVKRLGLNPFLYFFLVGKFFYGLSPQRFRVLIRSLF